MAIPTLTFFKKVDARGSVKNRAYFAGTRLLRANPGLTKQISPAKPKFSTSFVKTIFLTTLVKLNAEKYGAGLAALTLTMFCISDYCLDKAKEGDLINIII